MPARSTPFVYDGPNRLAAALREQVRAVVLAEYKERLASASWMKRILLKLEIHREVAHLVAEANTVCPSEKALY